MRYALVLIAIVFLAGCVEQSQSTPNEQTQQTPQETPQQQPQEPPVQQPTQSYQNESTQPQTQEFTFETNDTGYYSNEQSVTSIAVTKGDTIKITFNVRSVGTYSAGAQFRGCGTESPSAQPGRTTSLQFTANNTCTITNYWPSSGVAKASLQVMVS